MSFLTASWHGIGRIRDGLVTRVTGLSRGFVARDVSRAGFVARDMSRAACAARPRGGAAALRRYFAVRL
jgi:hypothetical protein